MEAMPAFLTLCVGAVLRLALPAVVTWVLIFVLRKLDGRWQAEAQTAALPIHKPECWKIKGCSLEQRNHCTAFVSPLPCWQALRLPNGYLREDCLSCKVFVDTPAPTFQIEPRRM